MTKKKKIVISVISIFVAIIVIYDLMGTLWSTETLFTSCQPEEIDYEASDPYCASIKKFKYTLHTEYEIWVTMKNSPQHGSVLSYPHQDEYFEGEIKNTKVNWTENGIELGSYLDTKLFISKKHFTRMR